MVAGGIGPLSSLPVLVLLPIAGAFMLPVSEFAVWTILNSVATVALATDFGGVAFVAANANKVSRPWPVVVKGMWISAIGSALVCAACMLAWIPYSSTDAAGGWSAAAGIGAISVVLFASVFRGGSTIIAAAALARYDYRTRNTVLLGQALIVVVSTVVLIAITASAWSLPIGWLIGSVSSILLVSARVRRDYTSKASGANGTEVPRLVGTARQFTIQRTAATLLSNLLSQGDRWIVGVAAGPEFLAAYELVWRFASAPRVVAMSLTASLVPDAKAAASSFKLGELLRESARTVWRVSIVASIGAAAVIVCLAIIGKIELPVMWLGLFLIVTLTMNGRTAVTSMAGIGIGRVGIDIPYLALMVVLTVIIWIIGIATASGVLVVIGGGIILFGVSVLFMVRAERQMTAGSQDPARKAHQDPAATLF